MDGGKIWRDNALTYCERHKGTWEKLVEMRIWGLCGEEELCRGFPNFELFERYHRKP